MNRQMLYDFVRPLSLGFLGISLFDATQSGIRMIDDLSKSEYSKLGYDSLFFTGYIISANVSLYVYQRLKKKLV